MRTVAAVLLLILSLVATASADDRSRVQAERAIRKLIVSEREYTRVYFQKVEQGFLSFSESKVTGRGVASKSSGWGGMPFTFSIKVHRDDLRTRNAVVEFADGLKITTNPSWRPPTAGNYHNVRITSPGWYQTVDNTFAMRGEADGRGAIGLQVFDRQGRIVHRSNIFPNVGGEWSTILRLPDGTYRAVASRSTWSSGDEVRFNVNRGSGDWHEGGWNPVPPGGGGWSPPGTGAGLNVMSPRNGATVSGSTTTISGTGRSGIVGIQIYRGNERVVNATVSITDYRWKLESRLPSGNYRLIASQGAARQIISFTVRNGWDEDDGWHSQLAIASPRNGSRVSGPVVNLNGSAPRGIVQIQIYRGNERVYFSSARVSNGRWGVSTRLGDGTYRVQVENEGRRQQITFTIRR